MKSFKSEFVKYINELQNQICNKIEQLENGKTFLQDDWKRQEGGGGKTRILENGNLIEKGGVNTSQVFGKLPQSMMQYLKVKHSNFFACGVSLVLHPKNPFVPTVHCNSRYFELYDDNQNVVDLWFAGCVDLTPYYLFKEDCIHFHKVHKNVCDKFDATFYPKYKKRCDEYFYVHHRKEARGIGGLFFDYLRSKSEKQNQKDFDFTTAVGNVFLQAYLPIIEKRKNLPFTEAQKNWQQVRRGRYVEFNLIHDKGTLFGLKTNGRIESILMSLPANVQWKYNFNPQKGSEEAKMLDALINVKDWI